VATIIDELYATLGLNVNQASFNNGVKNINRVIDNAAKISAGFIAAGVTVATVVNSMTAEMVAQSEAVGISTDFADNLGNALKPLGFDYEAVIDLAEELNNKIGESKGIEELTPVSESLGILGLAFDDLDGLNAEEQLTKVMDAAIGLEDAQAASAAADILMGGEANKITGFLKSKGLTIDELIKSQRDLNFMTNDARDGAVAWSKSMGGLTRMLTSVISLISGLVGKYFSKYIDAVKDIVVKHKELIQSKIEGFFKRIGTVIQWVIQHWSGLLTALKIIVGIRIATWAYGVVTALKAAAIAMRGFSLSALLIPAAIAAVGVAIGLLINDIYTFYDSGGQADTFFGVFAKKFPQLERLIKGAIEWFKKFPSVVKETFNDLKGLFDGLDFLLPKIEGFDDIDSPNIDTNIDSPNIDTNFFSWDFLADSLVVSFQIVGALITAFVEVFKSIMVFLVETWIEAFDKFKLIIAVVSVVFNQIENFISTFLAYIVSFVTGTINIISSIFNSLKAVIIAVWTAALSVGTTVFNSINALVTSVFNSIVSVITGAINSVNTTISSIVGVVSNVVVQVTALFISLAGSIISMGSQIFTGIAGGISKAVGLIMSKINMIRGAINSVMSAIGGFVSGSVNIKAPHVAGSKSINTVRNTSSSSKSNVNNSIVKNNFKINAKGMSGSQLNAAIDSRTSGQYAASRANIRKGEL